MRALIIIAALLLEVCLICALIWMVLFLITKDEHPIRCLKHKRAVRRAIRRQKKEVVRKNRDDEMIHLLLKRTADLEEQLKRQNEALETLAEIWGYTL